MIRNGPTRTVSISGGLALLQIHNEDLSNSNWLQVSKSSRRIFFFLGTKGYDKYYDE